MRSFYTVAFSREVSHSSVGLEIFKMVFYFSNYDIG